MDNSFQGDERVRYARPEDGYARLSSYVGSLKLHEMEIVDSLENVNLDSLLNKATSFKVIPPEVKKSLDSLDPHVPLPLKLRYLLLHAYERLEGSLILCERWIEVLTKHGVSHTVLDKVRASKCTVSSCARPTLAGGWESEAVIGAEHPQSSTNFLEKHVSALTEILASCSYKWTDISMSLNLPEKVRKNIEQRLHMYNNEACLGKVVWEWIVGGHEHAKAPTAENLKRALNSALVGLGSKAGLLKEENLNKHGIYLMNKEPLVFPNYPGPLLPLSKSGRPSLEIVCQSYNTEVSEEKSILLEVQAVSVHDTTIYFQWMKDGCLLYDYGKHYVGVNRPILCINDIILALKGTYTCVVEVCTGSDPTLVVRSDPIPLTITILPNKKILVDIYCSLPEVQEDTWPPVSSKTYTNLALIKPEKIDTQKYFSRSTIYGDMNDIMNEKVSICYEEAFSEYKSGAFVLVEGRPGCGKTTLVKKVSKDWASGKLILKEAKLVFLISLKVLTKKAGIGIIDLLDLFYHDKKSAKSVFEHISECNGEGVCFIMDGLDEYSSEEGDRSIIFKIIQKECLQRSMVIVASRHVATAKLRKMASTRIEVVGFLDEQILEYVDSYPFTSDTNTADQLKSYLRQHDNIFCMCYLPVHAAMVCFLHDHMKDSLPQTETGVYKHFTLFTLLRKLRHEDEYVFLESIDDLTGDNAEFFHSLCKLAFDMTSSLKLIFKRSEIPSLFKTTGTDEPFLGFVSVDHISGLYGLQNLFTFVHLTFQEYLSAYHISKLPEVEQLELINKYGKDKHMKVVWKFYCGLVDFHDQEYKFEQVLQFYDDPLFRCQCAFESQQPGNCSSVILLEENKGLMFENRALSPWDFTAINYILSNACGVLEMFQLSKCHIGISVNFIDNLRLCTNLHSLDLSYNLFGDHGAELVGGCLAECNKLRVLNLTRNIIGDKGAVALADGLKHCISLESLYLGVNTIGDAGIGCLCTALRQCRNLQDLHLSDKSSIFGYIYDQNIGDDGCKAISELLKTCCHLHSLHIKVSTSGVPFLAEGLKYCGELQSLVLDRSDRGMIDTKILFDNLKHCSNLQTLDLSTSGKDNDTAITISDYPESFSNSKIDTPISYSGMNRQRLSRRLQHLDFGICDAGAAILCSNSDIDIGSRLMKHSYVNFIGITDVGAKVLAETLKHCPNIRTLDLSHNGISDEGAKDLSESLKHCYNLEVLNLSGCRIGDEGARSLARSLTNCKRLRWLCLHQNNMISEDAARAVVEGLKHCDYVSIFTPKKLARSK